MPNLRSDAFCCVFVNCLAVAVMITLYSLQLNSVHPVILIGLEQVDAQTSIELATVPSLHKRKVQDLKGVMHAAANNKSYHPIKQEVTTAKWFLTTPKTSARSIIKTPPIQSKDKLGISRKPLSNGNKTQSHTLKTKESMGRYYPPKVSEPTKGTLKVSRVNGNYVYVKEQMQQPPNIVNPVQLSFQYQDATELEFNTVHNVLPKSAFFDSRPTTRHANSTVILVAVRNTKKIRYNRIVGCGIGDIKATRHKVRAMFVERNWIMQIFPNFTHTEAIVHCYDLPTKSGSKAFVLYRPYQTTTTYKVYSELPVVMSDSSKPPKPLSVVVCATVYDEPPWLTEWLLYQQTIGVDYIHLYAQESFIDKGGMNNLELKKLITANKLTVDVRKAYLNSSEIYYYSQALYYQDCILRYRGVYEFSMLIDTDDFFIPRVPGQSQIQYYLKSMFPNQSVNISSVKLDWIRFFPSCGLTKPVEEIKDGNITNHLIESRVLHEYIKSVHRLELVLETGIHEITYKLQSSMHVRVSNSTAYFAHVRKTEECSTEFIERLKETSRFKP